MQFMGSLYVGESIASAEYKIVEKVHKGKAVLGLYLISMSTNPDNMLDLIPQTDLLQKFYPKDNLKIVGIAGGKKEAIALVQSIIADSIQETGDADVRRFLNMKWEGQACR